MGYKEALQLIPAAIRWGQENEPVARRAYQEVMEKRGAKLEVRSSGLHLHNTLSYLGAGSDGMVISSREIANKSNQMFSMLAEPADRHAAYGADKNCHWK